MVLAMFYSSGGIITQSSGYSTSGMNPPVAIGLTTPLTTSYAYGVLFPGCDMGNKYRFFAKKSADGKTIFWYQEYGASHQFNNENNVYYYVIIG